jgi:dTDP-4-amino-4,6-dideoxygalactose transaminase
VPSVVGSFARASNRLPSIVNPTISPVGASHRLPATTCNRPPSSMQSTELALFTRQPRFVESLHVGRPNLGDRQTFLNRVGEMLDRRWLSNDGPLVKEFEQRICQAIGVRHCITMCNATIALEIAIRALELKGEVIVPSYTFVATAHALQWQEVTPIFADMDPRTHNLDPLCIEQLVTPRTSAIIGVHVWGRPCNTEAIAEIARKRNIKVMYDAAHAFGCTHGGRMIGGFGSCEILSFHATKFLNSFEGGAVVTNDDALAAKIRLMRNFGFSGYDNVVYLGTNGKMTEVCAAMGLTSLDAIDAVITINRRNYELYSEGLRGIPGISIISYNSRERNNYQYIVVEVDPETSALTRDEVVAVLHAENVLARKYFWPGCHRMEPYRSLQPNARLLLRETERISSRIMLLPTGQTIESEVIDFICNVIRSAVAQPEAVRTALARV